ncbi:outer membrane lipoprotein carrier protein LolA [Brevundimonas albigilva]|uniref:LolA family protein n=1 Tax=Brevundimonas albigilva TaxID=1312364 RepID=UPI00201B89A5|nr:outer membrane lipoprotein carrier protein LolA [Brevundimonas albigilva]UQV17143.1 outer membrane lipoprotein carrier protein LolA [Brevundimonas albigilva]
MTARVRALAPAPADLQRRQLLLGAGLLSGAAVLGGLAAPAQAQSNLSAADRQVVQRAQAYLQGLTSAQGTFVETGPNGQRRQGRFYLQRPGKMRFEYTDPAGLLVVSDGYNVKRYDPRLNNFQQVPLGRTPLSTFLAREVRLDQGVRIDRVTRMDSAPSPSPRATRAAPTTARSSWPSPAIRCVCTNGPSPTPRGRGPAPS